MKRFAFNRVYFTIGGVVTTFLLGISVAVAAPGLLKNGSKNHRALLGQPGRGQGE